MPLTPLPLFRLGNATSARFTRVRVPRDIPTELRGGVPWVRARAGGVSTFSAPLGEGIWWMLPAGTAYPEDLFIHNDRGRHYNWEPACDMTLDRFRVLLGMVDRRFRRMDR